jgi:hypothetical protein
MSSPGGTATAQANPNIAFIKYWGNHDWRYSTSPKPLAEFLINLKTGDKHKRNQKGA